MFKLPLLQPQLTGPNGVEGKTGQTYSSLAPFSTAGSRSGKESDLAAAAAAASTAAFEVRGWSRQAKDITFELTGSEKYKSLALHAEVKLAEALERCDRVSPITRTSTGEERPSKLRTAVACQLLGEFAELCGPFSQVLNTIKDELVKSIYSWYYVSDRGALIFDQLPWFSVAERLEREKEAMVQERELFKAQIQAQQDAVARIEEQLATFKRSTEAAQLEAAALRSHLEHLTASEEAARLEAKTGREELKRLRKEYLKMRDDLEAERGAHRALQAQHQDLTRSSQQQLGDLSAALERVEAEADEQRRLAESRVPAEVHDKTKAVLAATQEDLADASNRVKELETINAKLAHRLDIMTPRPVWRKAGDHGIQGKRTAEMVHKVEEKLGRYASELDELKARLQLANALLLPDPAPCEVQLTLVTDASNYFLTEGGAQPSTSAATAEPLGLAASVPRCLRWPERVPLTPFSLEDAEAMVLDIWKAKQSADITQRTGTLQSFLYFYFYQGMATADAVKGCYSLYSACATHAKASPVVRTFWLVLSGQVSERTYIDQQIMVSGLVAVLHSLPTTELVSAEPSQASEAGAGQGQDPLLRAADVASALEQFFPSRPGFRLNKLKETLAVHAAPGGSELSRSALVAALTPHGLQPPPPASAIAPATGAAGGRGARYKPGGPLPAHTPLGPFVSTLLAQHVDEIQAMCLDIATQMSNVPTTPRAGGGIDDEGGADVGLVIEKLAGPLPGPRALACVLCALGYSAEEAGGGGGGGGDVVMPSDLVVDLNVLGQALLVRCLVKPERNFDVSGTLRWCSEAFAGGEASGADPAPPSAEPSAEGG